MSISTKTHLIIVPGHSIWKQSNSGENAEDWHLESFQREGNDHLIFIEHIKEGVRQHHSLLEQSILIFSGGQTKEAAGPRSEAQSYHEIAQKLALLDDVDVHLEEYARDSFENVLFSLAKFYEVVGKYPQNITIVGFEFKRHRFEKLHLKAALGWDLTRVTYIGIDPKPPYEKGSEKYQEYFRDLNESENEFAIQLFKQDLLGNGDKLGGKKVKRNPFNRLHTYAQTNPDLAPFFKGSLEHDLNYPW